VQSIEVAQTVRTFFDECAAGTSPKAIADGLSKHKGAPPPPRGNGTGGAAPVS
jgi:hypothetical protein